jgi:hypothetical protein
MSQASEKQILLREKLIILYALFLVRVECITVHQELLKGVSDALLDVEYFREAPRGPLERFAKLETKRGCLKYLGTSSP